MPNYRYRFYIGYTSNGYELNKEGHALEYHLLGVPFGSNLFKGIIEDTFKSSRWNKNKSLALFNRWQPLVGMDSWDSFFKLGRFGKSPKVEWGDDDPHYFSLHPEPYVSLPLEALYPVNTDEKAAEEHSVEEDMILAQTPEDMKLDDIIRIEYLIDETTHQKLQNLKRIRDLFDEFSRPHPHQFAIFHPQQFLFDPKKILKVDLISLGNEKKNEHSITIAEGVEGCLDQHISIKTSYETNEEKIEQLRTESYEIIYQAYRDVCDRIEKKIAKLKTQNEYTGLNGIFTIKSRKRQKFEGLTQLLQKLKLSDNDYTLWMLHEGEEQIIKKAIRDVKEEFQGTGCIWRTGGITSGIFSRETKQLLNALEKLEEKHGSKLYHAILAYNDESDEIQLPQPKPVQAYRGCEY